MLNSVCKEKGIKSARISKRLPERVDYSLYSTFYSHILKYINVFPLQKLC